MNLMPPPFGNPEPFPFQMESSLQTPQTGNKKRQKAHTHRHTQNLTSQHPLAPVLKQNPSEGS